MEENRVVSILMERDGISKEDAENLIEDCREKMLDFVAQNEPTALNIYKVAKDILEHTSDERCETVENIMFHLGKEACVTFFTVM